MVCACVEVGRGREADAAPERDGPRLGWLGGGGAEAKMVSNKANPRVGGTELEVGGGTDAVLYTFPLPDMPASILAAVVSLVCDCKGICCGVHPVPPSLANSLSSSDTCPLERLLSEGVG